MQSAGNVQETPYVGPMKLILLGFLALLGGLEGVLAQQAGVPVVSFEKSKTGDFTRRKTRLGLLEVVSGRAEIDGAHGSSGRKCLHLFGGDETAVTLRMNADNLYEVRFQAERWTARDPFVLLVEAEVDGEWQTIEDASSKVLVGGFKTLVRAKIPDGVRELRLRCSSPEDTGVLIDDLQLVPNTPMECTSLSASQPVLPCLVGNQVNPILRVDLEWSGVTQPLEVRSVTIDLLGTTDLDDLESVSLMRGPETLDSRDPDQALGALFGTVQKPRKGSIQFKGQWTVGEGPNHLWLSVTPKAGANIDGRVDAGLISLEFADGKKRTPTICHPAGSQRLGIALRNKDSDGVPVYRIPGLATSTAGTLLCVYDQRHEGWRDLPGDMDIGLSRSTDGGRTWEPMRTILDMGNDPAYSYDGVGDPAILVDRVTGTIWVIASWHHGSLGWNGSGPGFDPEKTGQLMLVRSDDDGVSWSAPINITRQVKQADWCFLLQGPGRGICMEDGTLVFPAQYQLDPEHKREPRSTVLWSKDHGKTWQLGNEAKSNTTEAAVVELETGRLMLNMRDNRGRKPPGWRAVMTSKDMGLSWKFHEPSHQALMEPVCMASLLHVGRELTGMADGQLLFSNPAVRRAPRRRMTLRRSLDMGQTWKPEHAVLLDEGSAAGYSCLTMIDAETVGIVYECSRSHLAFQRIPLNEIQTLGD